MKKKITSIVLSLVLVLSMLLGNVVLANSEITVKLDGKTLSFDVPPQIINGRTMVPVRAIFEELGATVAWGNSTVTSVRGDTTVVLTIGVPAITVNGVTEELDAAPCIIDGRTLVPARAVSEAFDMNVDWDGNTKTVLITANSTTVPGLNVNLEAYNKLKSAILTQGVKEDNLYGIVYNPKGEDYRCIMMYDAEDDYITLFYGEDDEEVYINIYNNDNPLMFYKEVSTDGSEYQIMGKFTDATKTYDETINTFPENSKQMTYMILALHFNLMDIIIERYTHVSFADLGLYYTMLR